MLATSESIPRTFFRVIRSQHPSWADFLSNLVRDQPPRRVEAADPLEWAGVSVFDSLGEARSRASSFPVLGRYIAELRLPEGVPVLIRPSVGVGHWTLVGGPGIMLGLVVRVVPV
jgi:hypothetical protein